MDRCPDAAWNLRIGSYPFSQVAFHTLFFADYYLGPEEASFRRQPFHRDNPEFFGDYERLEHREPVCVYDRAPIQNYVRYCREKASHVITSETIDSLSAPCGFARCNFSRAELYIYGIRHIQHHAAQLVLRLRAGANLDIPWMGSGWCQT